MQDDVKQKIITLRDEARRGFDKYKEQFQALENGYLSTISSEQKLSLMKRRKSLITYYLIQNKVRKVVQDIKKTYFANDEFAKLYPLTDYEEDIRVAKILQDELDEYVNTKANLYTLISPNLVDVLVYGITVLKIYWNETIKLQRVSPKDVYFDPDCSNSYDVRYLVHKTDMTIEDLTKAFGKKIDFTKYIGSSAFGDVKSDTSKEIGDYARVEVVEVYRKQNGVWFVSTLIGDEFLRIDTELNDGLPFIIGFVYPQFIPFSENFAVRAYGDSFIKPMLSIQQEYIITRNQQLDAIDLQLNPRWLTTRGSGLKDEDLNGNIKKIVVNSIDGVQQLPAPNINQSIFNTDRLDSEMQEMSGITKYNQGLTDKGSLNQTATGMSLLTQSGNEVIEDIIRALNESFFEPLIARMVKLLFKYSQSYRFYGVNRENYMPLRVVINAGVGAVNKDMQIRNIDSGMLTLTQTMATLGSLGDMDRVARYGKALDMMVKQKMTLLGFRDIKKIIGDADDNRDDNGVEGVGGEQNIQSSTRADDGAIQQLI